MTRFFLSLVSVITIITLHAQPTTPTLIKLDLANLSNGIVLNDLDQVQKGALPAISFFFILLGMALLFPDMLQDESTSLSTMHVVVFMTISVFTIIAIKIGWVAENYDDFKIDRTWVYILGLAFGSKLFQNYTESLEHGKGAGTAPEPKPVQPKS